MKRIGVLMFVFVSLVMGLYAESPKVIVEVGAGVMYETGIYTKGKNRVEPFPLLNLKYEMFALEYDRVKCYITDDLAIVVGMGNAGYNDQKGMDSRDMAITAGGEYRLRVMDDLAIRFNAEQNFFGGKSGTSVGVELEKELALSETDFVSCGLKVKLIDSRVADYYYGVKESEKTADRRSCKVNGTFIPTLRLDYMKALTQEIYVVVSNNLEIYPEEIRKSPIVDRDWNVNTLVGVCYKFM